MSTIAATSEGRSQRRVALSAIAALFVLAAAQHASARVGDAAPDPKPTGIDTSGCGQCHAALLQRKAVHSVFQKGNCGTCHKPSGKSGKCKSTIGRGWELTSAADKLCLGCHDAQKLTADLKVKHEPVMKGRCAECHDPHGSELPKLMRTAGSKLCLRCHDSGAGTGLAAKRVNLSRKNVHKALTKKECQDCHDAGHGGARSKLLTKPQPDLCYGCHERKDKAKAVHTAVRQGECLECHDAHSSDLPGLAKKPRERLCFSCHELDDLGSKPIRHAPVLEGKCLDCHDPHGSDLPKAARAEGKALCLRCHDEKAPTGKGTPGPASRVDLKKKVVHESVATGECQECHESGHSSDNLKLLTKPPPDLCYGCHDRKDDQKFVHGAVRTGDCAVCHAPHSSDHPALLTRAQPMDVCFICHQDDVTGRAVVHKPVAEGKCQDCHGPHGAPNRMILKKGEGKNACYACHKPFGDVKTRHLPFERHGCTGCHDPHGTANRFLLAKPTNELCVGCHPGTSNGRHVSAWLPNGHLVGGAGRLDPRRPDRPFSCASCHNPHGSDFPKLFYFGSSPMESCDGCHGDKSGKRPELKNVTNKAIAPAASPASGAGGKNAVPAASGASGKNAAPGPSRPSPPAGAPAPPEVMK